MEEGSCSADSECGTNGTCVNALCHKPVLNAEVVFDALGADQLRVTDANGYYEYQAGPAGRNTLTATYQVEDAEGIRTYRGDTTFTLENQATLTDQNIILIRQNDPNQRLVVLTGRTELVDCDCTGSDETRNKALFGTCSVSPDSPEDDFEQSQSELCADEVGLNFWGHCVLDPETLKVTVTLNASFFEGTEGSCGGNEREAKFRDLKIEVAADKTEPVAITRLKHDDWCYYGLWAERCDNKAFFRDIEISNQVAEP
jgi:hypothetical protein